MTGEEIKNKILLIILKFHQISGDSIIKIQRSEFQGLSDFEILSTLEKLEKEKLINIIDSQAISNDLHSMIHKSVNPFGSLVKIKILNEFKKYVNDNNLIESQKDGDEIILRFVYENRKVKVNNIVIANPHFDSENDYFALFISSHPGGKITRSEFEKYKTSKMNKKFDQIITDLGFKGNIKKLFFPNISIKAVEFKSLITRNDMKKSGIDDIYPSDFKNK